MNPWSQGGDPSVAVLTRTKGTPCPLWTPRQVYPPVEVTEDAASVSEITPSNTVMLKWASRTDNQPSQEWWDDDTDPFA